MPPDRDWPHSLNRAVSLTTPPVICPDTGRNALRIPQIPAATFPAAWPRSRIVVRTCGSSVLTTDVSPPADTFRVSSVTSVPNAPAVTRTSGVMAFSAGPTTLRPIDRGPSTGRARESAHAV